MSSFSQTRHSIIVDKMAAFQATINRNILHSRYPALDAFHRIDLLSGLKAISRTYGRHGHHTAARLTRNMITNPIRFAALPRANEQSIVGTRAFSTIQSPSLLARASNPSFRYGILKNSGLSSAMRQHKHRHPFQMACLSPNIGSIAYFSGQNNLTPRPPPLPPSLQPSTPSSLSSSL